jgi:putative spermidine/putrescine transport system substrate-binding protein
MQRRSFLVTLGSLALAPMFASCQAEARSILRVLALKNSLPPQLLPGFIESIQSSHKVELVIEGQFKEILAQLQEWYKTGEAEAKGFKVPLVPAAKSSEYIPNVVSMGDAWLPTAIQSKIIEPIEIEKLANWGKLESRWHELAMRDDRGNSVPKGQVWGVPYRWGTTVIIYRRDKLEAAGIPLPKDWGDLWNPKLRQRISLLDRSREVIGLTLKKLGYSYNHPDLSQVKDLKSLLQNLHQQVKFYSADNYLQPLTMGDTWVAVGWSTDAIDLIQKNSNLGAIVPQSGTAIWADLWVQPTIKNKSATVDRLKLAHQWIDYSIQPQASNQISLFTPGTAPLLTSLNRDRILPDIQRNRLILPPKTILDKSEFIYPLTSTTESQFKSLWQEIRQSKVNIAD